MPIFMVGFWNSSHVVHTCNPCRCLVEIQPVMVDVAFLAAEERSTKEEGSSSDDEAGPLPDVPRSHGLG